MPSAAQKSDSLPPSLITLAAWIFPGLGYWLLGQRLRAIIVAVCILSVFLGGILIGGIRVVDAPTQLFNPDAILDKPWFIGQILAGPICIISSIEARQIDPLRVSHGRSNELGTLYTALAGMLNLLVIMDSGHRGNGQSDPNSPAETAGAGDRTE